MTPNRDDKALAGEYVLGLLEGEARAETERRIASDAEFAREVEGWRTRMLAFDDATAPGSATPLASRRTCSIPGKRLRSVPRVSIRSEP